jgi:chromosome segregation ATPase
VLLLNKSEQTPEQKASIVRELRLAQIEMNKLYIMIQRYEDEIERLGDTQEAEQIEAQIKTEGETVRRLRQELTRVKSQQSCRQEYEALAKLAATRHPVSKHQLEVELKEIEKELADIKHKLFAAEGEMKLRQAQFHHLMTSLLDFGKSLQEPVEDGELFVKRDQLDNTKGEDSMQVDNVGGSLEDDQELYQDLL